MTTACRVIVRIRPLDVENKSPGRPMALEWHASEDHLSDQIVSFSGGVPSADNNSTGPSSSTFLSTSLISDTGGFATSRTVPPGSTMNSTMGSTPGSATGSTTGSANLGIGKSWSNKTVYIPSLGIEYEYDRVLTPDEDQKTTYDAVCQDLIRQFLSGINCTVLAYGQTGTGKTYTIGTNAQDDTKNRGLVVRAVCEIFQRTIQKTTDPPMDGIDPPMDGIDPPMDAGEHSGQWKHSIHITFIELYNDEILDLLNPSFTKINNRTAIKISQSVDNNSIQLSGIKYAPCDAAAAALNLLKTGVLHRKTSSNSLNSTSSRSHAIYTIWLKQHNLTDGTILYSKFHFVDLAGSERVKRTQATGNT